MKPIASRPAAQTPIRLVLLVAVVAGALYMPGLGNHDLWAPDEPRYAQIAREMIRGGDWLLPHLGDAVYTDKPPGWFWCAALLGLPAGDVGPWAARLPSALAAVLLAVMMMTAGSRIAGARTAFLGTVVLLSSKLFFVIARSAHLDLLLCLTTTTALLAGWSILEDRPTTARRLVFWLALAAGLLIKGPVGPVLVLAVLGVDRLIAGEVATLRWLSPGWGVPLALLPAVLWLLAAGASHPDYRPLEVLRTHVLTRATSGLHHQRPFWYYGREIFLEMSPWGFLLPAALMLAWRRRRDAVESAEREDEVGGGAQAGRWVGVRFLVVWPAAMVGVLTLSAEKRGLYLLPALPGAALLVGHLWDRALAASAGRLRGLRSGLVVAGLGMTALAVLPIWLARQEEALAALAGAALPMAIIGFVTGTAVIVAVGVGRAVAGLPLLAAGTLLAGLAFVHGAQPAANGIKSSRPFARELTAWAAPDDPVGMVTWRAAYVYYAERPILRLETDDDVRRFLAGAGRRFLILDEEDAGSFEQELRDYRPVLEKRVGHRQMLLMAPATVTEAPRQDDVEPPGAGPEATGRGAVVERRPPLRAPGRTRATP